MSEWINVQERLPEKVGEEAIVVGSFSLGPEPYSTLVEYLGEGHWGTTRDDELNGFDSCTVTQGASQKDRRERRSGASEVRRKAVRDRCIGSGPLTPSCTSR